MNWKFWSKKERVRVIDTNYVYYLEIDGWNNKTAEVEYELKKKTVHLLSNGDSRVDNLEMVWWGNLEWAKRQAKHYGIKLPK